MSSITVKINDVFITNTYYETREELRICPETIYHGSKPFKTITFGDVVTNTHVIAGLIQHKITFDELLNGNSHALKSIIR